MYELPHKLPNDLRLRNLGNYKISGKSQKFIDLVHSPSLKMKILSVLIKISWKAEVEVALFHIKTRVCLIILWMIVA